MKWLLTCLTLFMFINLMGQEDGSSDPINVYVDCNFCDQQFIKQNLNQVEFVRDQKSADVHLLFTQQGTGNGALVRIQFIGRRDFSELQDTLSYSVNQQLTSDDKRNLQLRYIQFGLMPYWIQNNQLNAIDISVNPLLEIESAEEKDPWNHWVFNMGLSGWFNGQETSRSSNFQCNASAWRITEKNKFGIWAGTQHNYNTYIFEDTIYTNRQSSSWGSFKNVTSLSNHFSYGLFGSAGNSVYSNYDFYGELTNGIEFNFFDYKNAYSKQLIISYEIGGRFNDYQDTTVYNKTEELLGKQKIIFGGITKQTWGSFTGKITYQNFLHDFNKNAINFYGNLNIRVFKGLSWRFNGSLGILKNQVNIEKQNVSVEELLLQQQQLATGYSYWFNTGINYSFGSDYNSVVNPRFDL